MPQIVETFDPVTITNASVQMFDGENGTKSEGKKFGAIGTIGGETTLRELIKTIEGIEAAKRVRPEKMDLTISAHIAVKVMRDIFGFTNEQLKPGVYSYGTDSRGKRFTLTADVIDEFEDKTKLMAFPDCVTATGFTFNIENGADEVALMEVTLTAYPDQWRKIVYEAIIAELEDESIAETWHKEFNRELVAAANGDGGGAEG